MPCDRMAFYAFRIPTERVGMVGWFVKVTTKDQICYDEKKLLTPC